MGRLVMKRWVIILFVFVLVLFVSYKLYGTFAINDTLVDSYSSSNAVFLLDVMDVSNNTYTTSVSKNDSKDLKISILSDEDIDLNYAMYYSGSGLDDVVVGVLLDGDGASGVIVSGGVYTVNIRIINNSNRDVSVTLGISYGYVNGGDLIVDDGDIFISDVISEDDNLDSSGANSPLISSLMVPVFYDEYEGVWKKADETNRDESARWYDYSDKVWANVVLKDSDTIVDLSNNLNNGVNNGASWDRDNGYVDTGSGYIDAGFGNYYFGSEFSLVIRFKINSFNEGVIYGNLVDDAGFGIEIIFDDGNYYLSGAMFCSDNGEIVRISGRDELELDTWYVVSLVYDSSLDGDNFSLYIDGDEVASLGCTGSLVVSDSDVLIGYDSDIVVSDSIIFSNALSSDNISLYYSDVVTPSSDDILVSYFNFMDGVDIPNGTVISDSALDGTLGFYVWIPRFKYRVWNISRLSGVYSYTDDDGNLYDAYNAGIDIVFESGVDSTGSISCSYLINNASDYIFESDYINNLTLSEKCVGSNGEYYTHPAFSLNDELTGFWVSKFEISGSYDEPLSVGDVVSLGISSFQDGIDSALVVSSDSKYGIDGEASSYLIRNVEWGAVSYLTHSVYGLCNGYSCSDVIFNNSTGYYTGRSTGDSIVSDSVYGEYNYRGYKLDDDNLVLDVWSDSIASTTGNIYGVYDMAGGRWEYVMGFSVDSYGTFSYMGIFDSGYYDLYSYGEESNTVTAFNRSILGDGMGEVLLQDGVNNGLWYVHYNYQFNSIFNVMTRGGSSSNLESAGIYSFRAVYDGEFDDGGYRIVISFDN